ncbi:hypothetical protein SLA_2159 [Streptomyces laurentii]|uniref:Uncharacterized protein n=1 Tax=Streptomyces laurentii TaxID=39478 RepID=A0A169NCS5_STRLU|nr:hypothetical protein SLA_2159 [Streptomyces laurentii]
MTHESTPGAPAPSGAMCCRCKQWTYAPVEVGYHERPSGPGVTLYACPSHAVAMTPGPMPGKHQRHT